MATEAETKKSHVAYDLLLWAFSILMDLFFREIHPRSSWKIPRTGPVIFVAAPHANQFVDPIILMRIVRRQAQRRIAFLIANKSLKRRWIGAAARACGAVGVGRALDETRPAAGKIYLPDPDNDPTLVRGVGTNFEGSDFQVGGLIVLPSVNNVAANAEILQVIGPEELRLKKEFKGAVALQQLTGRKLPQGSDSNTIHAEIQQDSSSKDFQGTKFKIAPKIDQTQVYDLVFDHLNSGDCIGIFPEGGSHDRTDLLPLKAGVAIMALGAMAANPDCNLKIIPCGMNYFHAHKFRSRAVVEFGSPIEVPPQLLEEYKNGSKRDATGKLLDLIHEALVAVTLTAPDYDTLMLMQAVRRLYNPKGKRLPLGLVIELNRRLVKGYNKFKDEPKIANLMNGVKTYNKQLLALNVRDHQVEYAKLSIIRIIPTLIYRLAMLAVLLTFVLPGLVLFSPIFITSKLISIKKSKEALAASTVKIQARDVMATWKLLVGLALTPALYTIYNIILAIWTYNNRIQGLVPENVPLVVIILAGFVFFPILTFASLRFGEVGMDIAKSIRPLVLALVPASGNQMTKLRQRRTDLANQVADVINEFGPELFPDFETKRLFKEEELPNAPANEEASSLPEPDADSTVDPEPEQSTTSGASLSAHSPYHRNLPRNESFANLGSFEIFASRPQTPAGGHSRSRSGFFGHGASSLHALSPAEPNKTLGSKGALDDVSKKIRQEMQERAQLRESQQVSSDSDADSAVEMETQDELTLKKDL